MLAGMLIVGCLAAAKLGNRRRVLVTALYAVFAASALTIFFLAGGR